MYKYLEYLCVQLNPPLEHHPFCLAYLALLDA